jgi:hypothetical protein
MPKKFVGLENTVSVKARPMDTGIPQRGAEAEARKPSKTRQTLALDSETYQRLRKHAFERKVSHQAIMEEALRALLDKWDR